MMYSIDYTLKSMYIVLGINVHGFHWIFLPSDRIKVLGINVHGYHWIFLPLNLRPNEHI